MAQSHQPTSEITWSTWSWIGSGSWSHSRGSVRSGTIKRLIEGYPAHDFTIDKAETQTLLHGVDDLRDEVAQLTGRPARRFLASSAKSARWRDHDLTTPVRQCDPANRSPSAQMRKTGSGFRCCRSGDEGLGSCSLGDNRLGA